MQRAVVAVRAMRSRIFSAGLGRLGAVTMLLALLVGCAPSGPGSQGDALSRAATPPPVSTATATAIPSPTATTAPTPAATTADTTYQPPLQLRGWHLDWHDEFNGLTLDPTKWNVVSDAPGGYHNCCLNGPLHAWAPDDVSVAGGNLRLTTERRWFQGKPYTSGAVTTEGKFDFVYGRLDIRGRVPKGKGLWPAFWLLSTDPKPSFEVDVMEALGQDTHTDYMVDWAPGWHTYCQFTGPDFSADFHVYSFIWTPTSSTWLIDGVPRCVLNRGMPTLHMYLLLNDHIGGAWPVPPDRTTTLPQYTDIDYVRVYSPIQPWQSNVG